MLSRMKLTQELNQDVVSDCQYVCELWKEMRYHRHMANEKRSEIMRFCSSRGVHVGLRKLKVISILFLASCSCLAVEVGPQWHNQKPPEGLVLPSRPRMPRKPNPVLKSPRHASVQVNAVMVRGVKRVLLPFALPLPNSKLAWDYDLYDAKWHNFTVWESQDLRTWRIIGTVTAPLGVATVTEFDLGYSIYNAPKPKAFWKVSAAWKEGL